MTAGVRRALALVTMFAIASAVVVAGPTHRARAEDYPGQAEIDAARAAAEDLASGIDELDNAIAALAAARDEATANALLAGEDYIEAQDAADAAQDTLAAANERAEQAEKELAVARENLAAVAQAAYRDSGSMSQIGAVVGAESVDDVIARTEAFERGSDEADVWVQRVQAAELVASTMREYADDAATEADAAATEARSAYAEAQDAQDHAEQAVAEADATRADAVTRLAELRGVTVALEEERQAGLEAERAAREQAEAEERQRAAEEAAQAEETARPRPTSTATSTSTPKPTTTSSPKPTTTSTPKPTTTSTPKPTETSEPEETQTSEPEETSTPKPTATSEPETPATAWKSTAAQGVAASNAALGLSGKPYQLGASGPTYFDCSGLTSTAWSSAGHWITRSSRSQYSYTTHLSYSQIRPGDLVFYATNTSDPSTIYHVAMYVGNGMVMEAVNPSKVSGTRGLYAWMASNMMPYIGRP
ncbi:C40 family peptidase [Demequina gelatinilytica]|uniref:C40 family peptidase n=1 Tax=Demequina gelatinilytica TaxID=1638980 RepID=UPI0012E00D05|nr:C40 family peptidase [Demequina gelatinilytica]